MEDNVTISRELLQKICELVQDVPGLFECNCSTAGCEGDCTYATATQLWLALKNL